MPAQAAGHVDSLACSKVDLVSCTTLIGQAATILLLFRFLEVCGV